MTPDAYRQRLVAQLSSDDGDTVDAAARELSSLRGLAIPLLRKLQMENRAQNRAAIVYALSWQDDLRAWWPLLKLVSEVAESDTVRWQACEGIAYLVGSVRRTRLAYRIGLDVLIWALNDRSIEVRYYAAFALGASRDAAVIPALQSRLGDSGKSKSIVGTVGEEARQAIEWISWT